VRNIDWFEVIETRGHVENGKVAHWQVTIKVGFTLED
jgi:flavin-binding protein dodecin